MTPYHQTGQMVMRISCSFYNPVVGGQTWRSLPHSDGILVLFIMRSATPPWSWNTAPARISEIRHPWTVVD